MGKAEAGSAKAIATAIKAKGLGRLRWYCQVCEKQCRDDNGFQAHCRSEPHLRKMLDVGKRAGQTIAQFSSQFQSEFVLLLRTRHLTTRVLANTVYNEYIQDKHHIHMNATRWVTLSGFIQTLGKAGIVRVEEDDKGLWITWIDNSPATLQRQAAILKRDRAQMDGEERERLVLEEQIARAKQQQAAVEEARSASGSGPGSGSGTDAGLLKKDGEKITLSLTPATTVAAAVADTNGTPNTNNAEAGPGPSSSFAAAAAAAAATASTASAPISLPTPKPAGAGISIANPFKRPSGGNVFKAAAKADKSAKRAREEEGGESGGGKRYMSEAERLMKEDQARRGLGGGGGGAGRGGGYGGMGPTRTMAPKSRF